MSLTQNLVRMLLVLVLLCQTSLAQQNNGVLVVEKTEYLEILNFAKECNAYSENCAARNELLEAYKIEADKLIEHQSAKNVELQDDLVSHKRKNMVLYPLLGIAAGLLGGAFLIK